MNVKLHTFQALTKTYCDSEHNTRSPANKWCHSLIFRTMRGKHLIWRVTVMSEVRGDALLLAGNQSYIHPVNWSHVGF